MIPVRRTWGSESVGVVWASGCTWTDKKGVSEAMMGLKGVAWVADGLDGKEEGILELVETISPVCTFPFLHLR